ncbi:EamA family transporter [uncultured Actinomyces sp.]|uniref:EamA family transporter n=1 Tax=uncultured Actinomyces sp. TaxID=249061 RepID=UPI0028F0CAAB|nr:EamA family transporter [uncultured Actinomyces sp.]
MWILLACGSALFAGLTAVLAKIGIEGVSSHLATALRTVVVAVLAWLVVALQGTAGSMSSLSTRTWVFLVASGLATGAAWLTGFRAIALGDVIRVTPVDKSSTILTILGAALLLHEPLDAAKGVGMVLMALGTWLMIQPAGGRAADSGNPRGEEGVTDAGRAGGELAGTGSPGPASPERAGSADRGTVAQATHTVPSQEAALGAPGATPKTPGTVPEASGTAPGAPGTAPEPLGATPKTPGAAPETSGTAPGRSRGWWSPLAWHAHWLPWAVASAVFSALTSILAKVGIEGVDPTLGTAIRTLVVLALAWGIVLATGSTRQIPTLTSRSWVFLAASGLATGASWLCFYRALQAGPASVVVPIDKLSVLVTAAFSALWLRERADRRTGAGLVLLTAGTLVLLL